VREALGFGCVLNQRPVRISIAAPERLLWLGRTSNLIGGDGYNGTSQILPAGGVSARSHHRAGVDDAGFVLPMVSFAVLRTELAWRTAGSSILREPFYTSRLVGCLIQGSHQKATRSPSLNTRWVTIVAP
jgi:hypothetical protein